MNVAELNQLLSRNVLDIRFTRRRPRAGSPGTRRMLCTLDDTVLNSVNGRTVLNYLPGGGKLPYNTAAKNLCLAWDILMQSFRMVPAESVSVITTYTGDDTFWNYFNENIIPMSTEQKIQFMSS